MPLSKKTKLLLLKISKEEKRKRDTACRAKLVLSTARKTERFDYRSGLDFPKPHSVPFDFTQLPAKVCAFDIETSPTNLETPEKSTLAIAGVIVYLLKGERYRANPYRYFELSQLCDLERFLKGFDGIIIGHNLLNFDYRVLSGLMSLDGIVEKTCDTYKVLYDSDKQKRLHLNLNRLAQCNLGMSKSLEGKVISLLWRSGLRQEVIEYNKQDCQMTMKLWLHMIHHRVVQTEDRFLKIPTQLRISPTNWSTLTGQRLNVTFKSWKKHIERHGHAFKRKKKKAERVFKFDDGVSPETSQIFHRLHCSGCVHDFIFVTEPTRVFLANEEISCPYCGAPIRLSLRSTVMLCNYDQRLHFVQSHEMDRRSDATKNSLYEYPNAKSAQRWIESLRYWS